VAVAASASGRGRRTVVVGRRTANLSPGSTTTIIVPLNSTGRSLLKRFHRLPVSLIIRLTQTGSSSSIRRTAQITPAGRKR
jgi:hypothetical protein